MLQKLLGVFSNTLTFFFSASVKVGSCRKLSNFCFSVISLLFNVFLKNVGNYRYCEYANVANASNIVNT